MAEVRVRAAGWQVSEVPIAPGTRRGGAVADDFVERLARRGQWQPVHAADISAAERRGPETTAVEVEADVEPGVAYIIAARLPSGAITFHFPVETERRGRGAAAAGRTVRFQIPISQEAVAGERRGILGKVARTGPCTFDVITHSRGGLVLRNLVELQKSPKFKLRRAVLVASPNEGTPLASPKRFDVFVTWIANLLDLFPDNPFTTGPIAEKSIIRSGSRQLWEGWRPTRRPFR